MVSLTHSPPGNFAENARFEASRAVYGHYRAVKS